MKIKPLSESGATRFGVAIEGIDLSKPDPGLFRELGEVFLDKLYIVIRDAKTDWRVFAELCYAWGTPHTFAGDVAAISDPAVKAQAYDQLGRFAIDRDKYPGLGRVSGKKSADGEFIGMFGDGELDWHCNQAGHRDSRPVVGLYGAEGSDGSITEFCDTVTGFEALPAERRALFDKLIAVHKHWNDAIAPGLNYKQTHILKLNMSPEDDVAKKFVITSPGGQQGPHLSYNTIHHFQGMSREETRALFDELLAACIRPDYTYRHEWRDGDVILMDQTVTLHRRPTQDVSKRLLYRMAFGCEHLLKDLGRSQWHPAVVDLKGAA